MRYSCGTSLESSNDEPEEDGDADGLAANWSWTRPRALGAELAAAIAKGVCVMPAEWSRCYRDGCRERAERREWYWGRSIFMLDDTAVIQCVWRSLAMEAEFVLST